MKTLPIMYQSYGLNNLNKNKSQVKAQNLQTQSISSNNRLAFGASIKLNVADAVHAYSELLGVPVEKIADDAWARNFETVSAYPLKKAKKMADKADKGMQEMLYRLNGNITVKNPITSISEFATTLYKYTQMGGGEKDIFRCSPAVDISDLNTVSVGKITTPISLRHLKGVHSLDTSGVYPSGKLREMLYNEMQAETSKIVTGTDGAEYKLSRVEGCYGKNDLWISEKVEG